MKNIYRILSVMAILVLTLAACAPGTDDGDATPVGTSMVPTSMASEVPTLAEEATATEAATATEEATAIVPVTGGGMLNVMQDAASGNSFLVTDTGKAVYINTNDSATTSACYDECAQEWPPVLSTTGDTSGEVGTGVDSTKLGTITRTDGSVQLTYAGWPLYTYIDDTQPGDMFGQGMEDIWFLVSPEGQKFDATMAEATATPY